MASRRHGDVALSEDSTAPRDRESANSAFHMPSDDSKPKLDPGDYFKSQFRSVLFYGIGAWLAVTVWAVIFNIQLGMCPAGVVDKYVDPDPGSCTCDCWDGKFKGCYGRTISKNRPEFRHIYFNMTKTSYQLILLAAAYIVAFSSFVKEAFSLLFTKRQYIRWPMLIATIATMHPNVYGFWAFFNYVNDGWGHLFYTQLFFTVTELVNTIVLFMLSDESAAPSSSQSLMLLFIPLTISTTHVSISVHNYFENLSKGLLANIVRDIGLLGTDFVVIVACAWRIYSLVKENPLAAESWSAVAKYAVAAWVFMLFFFYYGIDSQY